MKRIIINICWTILILFLILNCNEVMGQTNVSRKDLLTAHLGSQNVSKVEIKEVTIPAGGKAAYHSHPCHVVGTVVSGSVLFQIEGQPEQILKAGSAFYEPKGQPILHFDNASETEPLIFVAYYLVEDNKELIEMLPQK